MFYRELLLTQLSRAGTQELKAARRLFAGLVVWPGGTQLLMLLIYLCIAITPAPHGSLPRVAQSVLNAASRGFVHLEATPQDGTLVHWCTELVGNLCKDPGLPQDTTETDALGLRSMRLVSGPIIS